MNKILRLIIILNMITVSCVTNVKASAEADSTIPAPKTGATAPSIKPTHAFLIPHVPGIDLESELIEKGVAALSDDKKTLYLTMGKHHYVSETDKIGFRIPILTPEAWIVLIILVDPTQPITSSNGARYYIGINRYRTFTYRDQREIKKCLSDYGLRKLP